MTNEIVEIIGKFDGPISAIIASLGTFLITQYTYNKNIPLDKLEISYNRLYYPMYCLIRNNKDVLQVVEKSEIYLLKYDKYVDRSTRKAFEFLKKNVEDKDAYNTYVSNISEMNRRLRRRLGYLEPNVLTMYTYSAPHEQFALRLLCELSIVYVFVMISAVIEHETIKTVFLALSIFSAIVFIVDVIMFLCGTLWKKLMKRIKSKKKKK